MNDYRTDVYSRIISMINLLSETDRGMSINQLAEKFSVGTNTVIKDLKNIYNSSDLSVTISTYDEEEPSDEFMDDLFAGKKNDIELFAVYFSNEELFSVELTGFERVILNSFLNNQNLKSIMSNKREIYVKNSVPIDLHNHMIISSVNDAIREEKAIQIKVFDEMNNKILVKSFVPLRIVNVYLTGEYYVVGVNNDVSTTYLIDNIKEVKKLSENHSVSEERIKHIMDEYLFRWGVGENTGIFDFELKVYDEANVIKRMKKELQTRKYGEWHDYDNYSIYTDKVIDYDSLMRWVMSYGSSVKVLKPKHMADDIYFEAKKRVEKYNEIIGDVIHGRSKEL